MLKQIFEIVFLVGMFFLPILLPIVRWIEYKRDCKRWGEDTAMEMWRRL